MTEKFKYGVVLSGGAVRGFAHLGALKALEENGIVPQIISGTSVGAMVGAFYADGYNPEQIHRLFSNKKLLQLLDISIPKKGFLKTLPIKKILEQHLVAKNFDELKKPLYICVTDLNNGKAVYISEGNIIDAVLASISIPVVFEPKIKDNITYVDGGVLDNLPILPIRPFCEKLIAINVNPLTHQKEINGVLGVIVRSFLVAAAKEIKSKIHLADLYIETVKISKYSYYELSKANEMFKIGYEAVVNSSELKNLF